jgi:uncharacterized protein (DUF697 family)
MYYSNENNYSNEAQGFEMNPEYLGEFNQEYSMETEGEVMSNESTFGEATQMEFASRLLSVSNEGEMDQFLGDLFKKAVGGVGSFMRSSTGRALGGILKNVAKKALPMAGSVLGNAIVPGLGGIVGSTLGNVASNLFELNMEGMSQEDREFQTAKAFVRYAGNAAKQAASNAKVMGAAQAARTAAANAARRYARGLLVTNAYVNTPVNLSVESRLIRMEGMLQDLLNKSNASQLPIASDSYTSEPVAQNEYWG